MSNVIAVHTEISDNCGNNFQPTLDPGSLSGPLLLQHRFQRRWLGLDGGARVNIVCKMAVDEETIVTGTQFQRRGVGVGWRVLTAPCQQCVYSDRRMRYGPLLIKREKNIHVGFQHFCTWDHNCLFHRIERSDIFFLGGRRGEVN